MKRYLASFLTLLVYSVLLFMVGRCTAPQQKAKPLQPVIEFTLPETVQAPIPPPAKVIEVPVPIEVDTAAILKMYYSSNIYHRPLIDIPHLKVSVIDTVYNNRLIGSSATYSYRIPQYKHDVSVGFMAGYNSLSLMATYRYNRLGMSAGYDLMNKSLVLGANYRLFRW